MSDLISRQAVINLLKQMRKDGDMVPWEGKDVFARIRKLPSAQPERKTGRWEDVHIDVANDDKGRSYRFYSCTACGVTSIPAMLGMKKKWLHFCPNCGAKMEDCEA